MSYLAFALDMVLPVAPMHNTAHAVPAPVEHNLVYLLLHSFIVFCSHRVTGYIYLYTVLGSNALL